MNSQNATGTPTAEVVESSEAHNVIRGSIEKPEDGAQISLGSCVVSGWALCGSENAQSVVVSINGVPRTIAHSGAWRADVPAALGDPDASSYSGWSATVTFTNADGERPEITATACARDGRSSVIRRIAPTILAGSDVIASASAPRIRGSLDEPERGATIQLGRQPVSGWAMCGDQAAAVVVVSVNGVPQAVVKPDIQRPMDDYPGWATELYFAAEDGPEPMVTAVAYAPDGSGVAIGSAQVALITADHLPAYGSASARPRIRGALEEPDEGARIYLGRQTVYGWAICGEHGATAVMVSVNGVPRAVVRPDIQRTDVYDGPFADTRAGWSAELDFVAEDGPEPMVTATAYAPDGSGVAIGSARTALVHANHLPVRGDLSIPAEEEVIDGDLIRVHGWVLFGERSAYRVNVQIDGDDVGGASINVNRHDVARLFPSAAAPVAGFEKRVVVRDEWRARKYVEVSATAQGPDGTTWHSPKRRVAIRAAPKTTSKDLKRIEQLVQRTERALAYLSPLTQTKNKIRALVFTHTLSLGGAELYLEELLRQLNAVPDMQISVVAPMDGPSGRHLEEFGIPVHVTAPYETPNINSYEGRVREFASLMKMSGCNIVLVNSLRTYCAVDAAQRLGIPTLWSIHESFELADFFAFHTLPSQGSHPYVQQRAATALSNSSALIFEANATNEMYARYASSQQRITIPYGINLDEIDTFRNRWNRASARMEHDIPANATVLLLVGAFETRKAPAMLVTAFSALADAYPESVLVLVGNRDDVYSSAVREQIARTELNDRIKVIDATADIYQWYGLSDVMVCPSDIESLPRSVLEAMAFELPVIASNIFGLPELIEDGKNGWLPPETLKLSPICWREYCRWIQKLVEK